MRTPCCGSAGKAETRGPHCPGRPLADERPSPQTPMKTTVAPILHSALLVCLLLHLTGNLVTARPALKAPESGRIQRWVDAAREGQIVEIPVGTYAENVVITKSLTLRGTNATDTIVDGMMLGSVFVIQSNLTVTLDGLTILNGFNRGAEGTPDAAGGDGFGGGVQNHGSALTVINCILSNNVAQGGNGTDGNRGGNALGGGIWHQAGTLILSNCLVTGNGVRGGEGAAQIFNVVGAGRGGQALGGGLCALGGTLRMTQCLLTNNGATGGSSGLSPSGMPQGDNVGGDAYGGAIFQAGDTGFLAQTVLASNTVSGGAGIAPASGVLLAEDGKAHGGALAVAGGVLTLDGCEVRNNRAVGVPRGKGGGAYGGGLYQGGGTLNVTGTTFATNTAAGGFAGWSEVRGTSVPEAEEGSGGAIFNAGAAQLTHCAFLGNASQGGTSDAFGSRTAGFGGAILNSGSASVLSSVFSGNTVLGGHGLIDWRSGFVAPGGPGCGGAICNLNTLVVGQCRFASNVARGGDGDSRYTSYGEARGAGRGGAIYSSGSCVVSDSSFFENTAAGGAGRLREAWFDGNAGDGEGGGILSAAELVAERNTFDGNRAVGGDAPLSSSPDTFGLAGTARGGGMLALGYTCATNNTFYANSATGGQGRTLFPGGDGLGGGVYGPANLSHCTLAGNRAEGGVGTNSLAGNALGGAVCTTNGSLTLRNSIMAGSLAGGNASGTILDAGFNLSSDASYALTNVSSRTLKDPLLGPLADHGGSTPTMALLPGSPAIDAGSSIDGPAFDQRGVARPHEVLGILNAADGTDIGALEYVGSSWCHYALSSTQAAYDANGGSGTLTVTVDDPRGEWTVINPNAWIVSLSPTHGVGSGSLQYTLQPNSGPARTGTVTIAGQTLTVTQAGDTVPPQITCPPDLVAETDPGQCFKSHLTFAVNASDDGDTNLAVLCQPPADAAFPKGVTLVTCSATDRASNRATCTFTVTVADREPPQIVCPPDLVVAAEDGSGAAVAFSVTASDNCAILAVACLPPSGSTFALGTTPIDCLVTDSAGSSNRCGFRVTVTPPNAAPVCEPRFPGTWTDANTTYGVTLDGMTACLVLDGSASHDPDTNALQFTWRVDGTNVFSGPVATSCLATGYHAVVLEVSDGLAQSRCDRTLCVLPVSEAVGQCVRRVEASKLPQRSKRPLIVSLSAASSSFGRGNVVSGVNQLQACQTKVRAQIAPDNPVEAADFIDGVQRILDAVQWALHHAGDDVAQ